MIRRFSAAGAALLVSGCIVQAPPGYYSQPYAPSYYPRPYPQQAYPPPVQTGVAPGGVTQASGDPGAGQAPYAPPPQAAAGPPPADQAEAPPAEARNPNAVFADEAIDYGVPSTSIIRERDFDAPTPLQIQGAHTITTLALEQMLRSNPPPVLIDTIRGTQTVSLPNAVWLRDAGTGRHMEDDIQAWLDMQLSNLTGRDKSRPLVFFCASRMCWLAHNAVVRAVDLGYQNVYWYRGGRDAWRAAQLPLTPVAPPPS